MSNISQRKLSEYKQCIADGEQGDAWTDRLLANQGQQVNSLMEIRSKSYFNPSKPMNAKIFHQFIPINKAELLGGFRLPFFLFVAKPGCPYCRNFANTLENVLQTGLFADHLLPCYYYDSSESGIPSLFYKVHKTVPMLWFHAADNIQQKTDMSVFKTFLETGKEWSLYYNEDKREEYALKENITNLVNLLPPHPFFMFEYGATQDDDDDGNVESDDSSSVWSDVSSLSECSGVEHEDDE